MRKSPSPQEWLDEFKEFMALNSTAQPPRHLTGSIMATVHRDLNPSLWTVFLKLSLIHAIVGGVTLLFCPQFGFSLTSGMGLMGIFMRFGEQACMVGCGAVFMGGSLLAASLLLRPEEVRAIRKKELLQVALLALLSVGAFICVGSGIVASLAVFWILGSVLGGLGTLELGWAFRKWVWTIR